MKNTTITQQDYRAVFRKYDSPSTFIYLDPPYEKSADLYKEGVIDYEDMAKIIKSAKGKVMLSINDSPQIRAVFKGLKISKVRVRGGAHGDQSDVGQDRNELLITNY
jgi:DNA adenine methylase